MTDREQIIAELQYMKRDVLEDSENDITLNKAIALLKEQPEIVRCKDCKHYNVKSLYCEYDLIWENRSPDWYCADGERKSDK